MDKLRLTVSMFIFGTIGLFVKYIPMPSSVIACVRGFVGAAFLILVCLATKKRPDLAAIRKNLLVLCISGGAIGINWILLFEAYRYTTVAVATLCYYMSPVFVILFSPLVLKEKMTAKKIVCVGAALLGMLFVSGVIREGVPSDLRGILLGLAAAAVYASIIFMNKKTVGVPPYDKTVIQLASAGIVVLPYCFLTVSPSEISTGKTALILLAAVGIIHTGVAYLLYFGSMEKINSQTIAILSYIDPVVAVILSALILREELDIFGIIGAVLIIGAALISELPVFERKKA